MVDNGQLTFEPAVASKAISTCSTLIGQLLAVKDFLGSRDIKDFAGPETIFNSGRAWTDGFRSLDTDLTNALTTHVAVVTALSDTFKAAIKEFKNAEDASMQGFVNATMPDKAAAVTSQPDYTKLGGKVPKPDPVEKFTNNRSTKQRTQAYSYSDLNIKGQHPAWPENPYAKSWNDLYQLGQSIEKVPGNLAVDWGWMKDQLTAAVTAFKTDITDGHFRNSWTGESGSKAVTAADGVATGISDLTSKMGDVESALYKAEGWLESTKARMPKQEKSPEATTMTDGKHNTRYIITDTDADKTYGAASPQDCVEAVVSKYRQDCEAYYVAGVMEYNGLTLALPQPTAPKVDQPAAPGAQQPKDQGAPDKSGSPSVTQSGSPSTQTPSTETPSTQTPSTETPSTETPSTQQPTTTQSPTTTQTPSTTTDSTLSTLTSALSTLAQNGTQLVESVASQGSSLIQSLVSAATNTQKTTETGTQPVSLPTSTLPTTDTGSPSGSPTGGSPTGGSPSTPETPAARLYPRATVATETETETEATTTRAGLATTAATTSSTGTGMSGAPMGGAGAAGQGGGKDHKRAEFLKSGQHLEEVFEAVPEAVTPVAEK